MARIADEHEALHVAQGIDERGELLLGQHGALVYDHRPVVAATRGPRFREIRACRAIIPLEPVQELGEGQPRPTQPGLRFKAHARLAGWREEQQPPGSHVRQRAEHPEQRRLPSSRRTDEDGKPRPALTAAFRRLQTQRAASATRSTALSGSHFKAPGFAGGYSPLRAWSFSADRSHLGELFDLKRQRFQIV
jgi:hypothetical protein